MMNRMPDRRLGWLPLGTMALASVAATLTLAGCGEDPPPPVVINNTPPPPPPPPPPPSVDQLRAEMNIDERVKVDRLTTNNPQEVRAMLRFFDAWVKGDANTVREMLRPEEQAALDDLLASGQWQRGVAGISEVHIVTGSNPQITGVSTGAGALAVLAIFTVDDEFEPTLWYMDYSVDGPEFVSAPTPPDILQRISGDDMIAAWHKIIEEEIARASQPDVDITVPQTVLEQRGGPGGDPNAPPGPGPGSPPGPGPGAPPGPGGNPPGGPGPGVPL